MLAWRVSVHLAYCQRLSNIIVKMEVAMDTDQAGEVSLEQEGTENAIRYSYAGAIR